MAISINLNPPNRQNDSSAQFVQKADAFANDLVSWAGQVNETAEQVNLDAGTAADSANAAEGSASDAAGSASAAAQSALIAQGAANYQGEYDAGTFYAVGESVTYLGSQFAKKTTAPAGTTPADGIDWSKLDLTDGAVGDIRLSQGALTAPWLEANGGIVTKAAQPTLSAQMGSQWPYEIFSAYGTADTNPVGTCENVTFSGDYIALGFGPSPHIHIYDWNNGSPTKISDPAVLPTGWARDVLYSPDGNYLAVAHETSPYVTFYDNSTPSVPVKLSNPASLPHANAYSVSWTSDSRYCAVAVYGNSSAERVRIYDFQSGSPVVTGGIDVDLADVGWCALYSPDDAFLVAGTSSSPYVYFYDATNPGTPTKMTDPATLPTSTVLHVSWSSDGRYVAAGTSSGALIYDMQSGSPVYVGTAASGTAGDARCFWLDDTTFAIPASTTRVWEIDGVSVNEVYSVVGSSTVTVFPFNARRMMKREVGVDKHVLIAGISSPYFAFQPQVLDPLTEFRLPLITVDSDTFGGDDGHDKIKTFIRGE